MTPWVKRLIFANVAVFIAQMASPMVTFQLELAPSLVLERPWTLLTYMFVHDPRNFVHIIFNMLTLFWVGPRVEQRLGERHFILLYLASGLGGAVATVAIPGSPPVIGASGAIMGVLIAYAVYWPRDRFYLYGLVPVEAWLLVTIYVILDVSGAGGLGGAGIAHWAHLGGLATGFVYLKATEFFSPARTWKRKVESPARPVIIGDGDSLRRWREIRLDDLHPVNRDEVVRLLQKTQTQGMKSLTVEERATLNRFAGVH